MNTLKNRVLLDHEASEREVSRAVDLLKSLQGVVTVKGIATLHPGAHQIRCEISAPTSAAARCEEEYKVLVENAARALRSSLLGPHLPDRRLLWVVMDGTGDDAVELWREP